MLYHRIAYPTNVPKKDLLSFDEPIEKLDGKHMPFSYGFKIVSSDTPAKLTACQQPAATPVNSTCSSTKQRNDNFCYLLQFCVRVKKSRIKKPQYKLPQKYFD
ncbi:hypothetical protein HDU92_008062 [Lobulomyces angularis]|nr:hypothetical protein HDU92_008062 [Lobulomyces angularis]